MRKIQIGIKSISTALDCWRALLSCDCREPDFKKASPCDYETVYREIDRYQAALSVKWLFFALINGPEMLP